MLTADNQIEKKKASYSNGCDDYLVKPFEPSELLLRIKKLLNPRFNKNISSKRVYFGDFEFGDSYEDMQESWPYGTNFLLIVLILFLTLFMMNVFIAVISSAYDDCLVEAAKYFEKVYIDVSFYKSRSKAMKSDVLKYYFKLIHAQALQVPWYKKKTLNFKPCGRKF